MIKELKIHSSAIKPQNRGSYLVLLDNHCDGGTVTQWSVTCYLPEDGWITANFEGEVIAWAELPPPTLISLVIKEKFLQDTINEKLNNFTHRLKKTFEHKKEK